MRIAVPRGRAFAGAALYGIFSFGGAFGLAYYGLQQVQAGIEQTVLTIVPLATLLLAVAHRQEHMNGTGIVGTLLAVGGIAIVSGATAGESPPVLSMLAIVGSALCFAEGAVLAHRFPSVHPVALNEVRMGSGSVLLLLAAAVAGNRFDLPEKAATWWAIVFMVFVGSVLVFVLYVFVPQRWEASRASYTLYSR
jgi:drug/metabolite transporter (DMT)-like permease